MNTIFHPVQRVNFQLVGFFQVVTAIVILLVGSRFLSPIVDAAFSSSATLGQTNVVAVNQSIVAQPMRAPIAPANDIQPQSTPAPADIASGTMDQPVPVAVSIPTPEQNH